MRPAAEWSLWPIHHHLPGEPLAMLGSWGLGRGRQRACSGLCLAPAGGFLQSDTGSPCLPGPKLGQACLWNQKH